MKSLIKFTSLIAIMLMFCGLLATEVLQAQSTASSYKVQVASHRNPAVADFAKLAKVGEVRAENLSSGITRIVLGYYANKADAEKVAAKVQAMGYKDAFVRKHDGSNAAYNTASAASQKVVYRRKNPNAKINTSYIPMEKPAPKQEIVYTKPEPPPPAVQPSVQTIYKKQEPAPAPTPQVIYTQPPVQVATVPPAPVYVQPAPQQQVVQQQTVVNTVVETACPEATAAAMNEPLGSNQTYMIDLGIYPDPNTVPSLGAANQLGIIYQKRTPEGGNIAYFGEYGSLAEAQSVLRMVRLQRGLSCAVIRKLDRISLEENGTSEVTVKVSGVAPTMSVRNIKITAEEAARTSSNYYTAPAQQQQSTTTTTYTTTVPGQTQYIQGATQQATTYTIPQRTTTTYTQGAATQQQTTTTVPAQTQYIQGATQQATTYTAPQQTTTTYTQVPATTTTAGTATSVVSAFTTLRSYFPPATFTLLNIDAFDPTVQSPNESNDKLRGNQIPPQLVPMVDNTPNRDPNLAFYALQQFAITPQYQGYIVRTGTGKYDNGNNIYMYVFDQKQNKFTQKYNLSSVSNTNGVYAKQQSWIVDLSSDGVLDILSYKISEATQGGQQFTKDKQLNAKVWVDNQFLDAQIVDENKLKQKLGLE